MLAACAARLRGQEGMVWVDLGGGTGENVDLMASYINLSAFKQIYVVDLCKSLCEQVRACTACTALYGAAARPLGRHGASSRGARQRWTV